jgi:hypothetical protein
MRKSALLFVVMALMLAVAAPAMAKPDNAAMNHPDYWEDYFAAEYPGLHCYKVDDGFGRKYKATRHLTVAIVKGGPTNVIYEGVDRGDWLTAGVNPKNGKTYGISHIIFCKMKDTPSGGGYST